MTYLTALLPVGQGVAAYAALTRDADTIRATGDPAHTGKGKHQVMADLLVERLTGQRTADAVPVTVNLVMSDETLLASGHDPAVIPGHGPIPAQVARTLLAHGLDTDSAWLRRLYADPAGQLVATTSKQRFAPDGLAALLQVRDQGICRTPWCDAPTRHADHIEPWDTGGTTDQANTQGLCQTCNHTKQAPGWHQSVMPGTDRHTVETTTPTGHRHRSRAPAPPEPLRERPPFRRGATSPAEFYLSRTLFELAL